jgi:predicted PurR-regulated permease PerM
MAVENEHDHLKCPNYNAIEYLKKDLEDSKKDTQKDIDLINVRITKIEERFLLGEKEMTTKINDLQSQIFTKIDSIKNTIIGSTISILTALVTSGIIFLIFSKK